jgi:hypothetical protein
MWRPCHRDRLDLGGVDVEVAPTFLFGNFGLTLLLSLSTNEELQKREYSQLGACKKLPQYPRTILP